MSDTTAEKQALVDQLGFDPDSLRQKYNEQRDMRIRPDGNEQYIEVKGDFTNYIDDPYVEPGFEREPLEDEVDVVLIGGGFGGLILGARLREAGIKDIRMIEKGGDFGGTWYWNRYPGAACDVESYIYLPLLEELGYMPTHKFTTAAEILAHSKAIGEKYDLYSNACFQTEVTEVNWNEETSRWVIETNRKDKMKARYVCMANGPLNRPKLPGIPGIDDFKGHTFHTSRWDFAYTGGNAEGDLDKLSDKRVGIIGTGATAVQCVPHLGEGSKELFVFQRTPSSVDVRNDKPTDEEWVKTLEPGWQKKRMENFTLLTSGGMAEEDMVNDGWTEIIGNLVKMLQNSGDDPLGKKSLGSKLEIADFQKMNQIRERVDNVVKDHDTAESLKPWYRQFCKRPCFHDEYLETFNKPNVHLVDTRGKGVERITEKGVVANGKEYELDCLIFATGFEVGTEYTRRSGYDLQGKGGQSLKDKWSKGMSTLHGMITHGFPNMFLINNAQAGFTVNFPHQMDEQARHIAWIIDHCMKNNASTVEVSQEAEDKWVKEIINMGKMSEKFLESCTPGYYNNEGKPGERSVQDGFYGAGPTVYFNVLKNWRDKGDLQGLILN